MKILTILKHWDNIKPSHQETIISSMKFGLWLGGIIVFIISLVLHWIL